MRFKIFILLGVLSLLASAQSVTQTEAYRRWTQLPSDTLIDMGSTYAEHQNKPDSGLVCFTIVTSRYKPEMPKQDKRLCAQGYMGKWYVYFFCYYDHSQAFENLLRAQEITEATGDGLGRVLLNYGATYQTISEQSGDLKPDSLALVYYKQAYWQSKHEGDTSSLQMAMSNMITVAFSLRQMDSVARELADYKVIDRTIPAVRFNVLLFEGLRALQQGRSVDALVAFERQRQSLKQEVSNSRYHFAISTNMARAYAQMGDYRHAIAMASDAEVIANQLEMKDARLEIYDLLAEYYLKNGDTSQSDNYRKRYYLLKDSLLNYHQVAGVDELRFMSEMKKVDKQLQEMDHQRRMQSLVIKAIVGIAVIILLSLLIVWRANRKLRQRNEMLYQKNVDMLQREQENRQQRQELKQAEMQARRQAEHLAARLAQEQARQQAEQQAAQIAQEQDASRERQPKYKSSSLDDESKQQLISRIRDVMDTTQEIYSPEFSAQQLAALVNVKYNYISQVINENLGMNFNAFVNEYRIREACRRINDIDQYGQLTIEGIANSVGFKSRTTFVQSFKKFTGLTPSEYQRIAREKAAK